MTVYEHAMIGIDGALAMGLQRRHGWQIIALAGFAAVLPDFDGLTILFGPHWYAEGHRLWGHNLLVAGMVAAIVSAVAYQCDAPAKIQRWLAKYWKVLLVRGGQPETPARNMELCLWIVVGVAAAYSHLLMDVVYSGGRNLPIWGVPLFWPFTSTVWACPLVPWGSIGTTVILAASMFAMLRWPTWIRTIATGSLIAVLAYMTICGMFS
jgi:membrane-bound metal-dependent hydrolase YbcI (DUF457 family)